MNGTNAAAHEITLAKPFVLWLTGLSGAGKSTLARCLLELLRQARLPCDWLDGDAVREAVGQTGFSREDRERHLRYVGLAASMLERNGIPVIASFVSPYRDSRNAVRKMCRNFIEVYLNTSLAECERRDVKGLYQRARSGDVRDFTGIGSDYEAPLAPEIVINSGTETVEECALQLFAWLHTEQYLT